MISIVVPVYNAENYIRETMEMVRKQSYRDWELLLVDDASSDGSVQVMEKYLEECKDGRIHIIKKEKNEGAAAARNEGIRLAKGRYLAFLDADDIWLSDKLSLQLEFMEKNQSSFVFTAYEFGDEKAVGTGKIVHVPSKLTYEEALSRTVIFTTTVLLDTEKIGKELIYMPRVPSEDSATWWQILRKGHVAEGMDRVTAIYRRPEKSLSSNKFKAMKRIWFLYRKVEKLPLIKSSFLFVGWAYRATRRRI
ncbi:MAG: glycosyltransferase family 2 protein [Lachnospiraceae bacterium]|nr:glycosyltransferase family 2 protein [Lachnospiraceae bacterium]